MENNEVNNTYGLEKGVILYGDSIFFGVGASSRHNGCGYLLKQLLDYPVEIRSRPGVTSEYAVENFNDRILRNPRKHVLVMFGNNDCRILDDGKPTIDKDKYYGNLLTLIKKIRDNKCKPVICNLQPICNERYYKQFPQIEKYKKMTGLPIEWQSGYSEIPEKISVKEKIPFINIRSDLAEKLDEVLSNDGLHPNDLGHKIIAKTLCEKLKVIIERD
jgi:lysophospholipase L1-like esterase